MSLIQRKSASGEFRPLGYWEKQGYDANAIKEKASEEDKREDPIFGTVYRVLVLGSSTIEDAVEKETTRVGDFQRRSLARHRSDASDGNPTAGRSKGNGKGRKQVGPSPATIRSLAGQLLTKTAAVMVSLEQDLKDQHLQDTPEHVRNAATEALATLKKIDKEAKLAMSSDKPKLGITNAKGMQQLLQPPLDAAKMLAEMLRIFRKKQKK